MKSWVSTVHRFSSLFITFHLATHATQMRWPLVARAARVHCHAGVDAFELKLRVRASRKDAAWQPWGDARGNCGGAFAWNHNTRLQHETNIVNHDHTTQAASRT